MKVIATINRGEQFGTLGDEMKDNNELLQTIIKHLKQGSAKLLVDTEHTLSYELDS
jgi:hypothetical protein